MKYLLVLLIVSSVNAQQNRETTLRGNFVEYHPLPHEDPVYRGFTITWGTKNWTRTYSDTIFSRYFDKPNLIGETADAVIVSISPANFTHYALVLPLSNRIDTPVEFEYPYDYDLKRNLIAYCGDASCDTCSVGDYGLVVQNFLTGEKRVFETKPHNLWPPCENIYNVKLQKDSIFYSWQFQYSRSSDSLVFLSKVAPLGFSNRKR
jgi:hypothetical protein